jgi:L-serine dehydratase
VEFPIPFDEVASAMGAIGRSMPPSLRETARGGLAVTPTGRELGARD